MPLLKNLDEEEARTLIHKIRNSNKSLTDFSYDILTDMTN